MRLLLIVNVMIKKMPEFAFRHYRQNKCAINHYFTNDSNILHRHFLYLSFMGSKRGFYNKILLTITTRDASKTRRIIFFMI